MSPEDESSSQTPGTLLVFSKKPPEEARIFDLRESDIISVEAPMQEDPAVIPEEWGITGNNEDGVCKYCQLMLHSDAPKVVRHQPNLESLVTSTCRFCGWVEVSIAKGIPELAMRYSRGDPKLHDPNDTSSVVTLELSKEPMYTRLVASVGPRRPFMDRGLPMISVRVAQLGSLSSRRFWHLHDEDADALPHERLFILKDWLDACSRHQHCAAMRDSVLPTRVLDLTGSPDVPTSLEDIKVKLRETSEGELGRYMTLSYCWGGEAEHHFKTTKEHYDGFKRGIDYASLPLTHREAILTTLFLGVRFLWIDSMCIIQDDAHDWEAEAARMSSVYANSLLTLAATSSSGPQEGLLNPYQSGFHTVLDGDKVMLRMETHQTIDTPSAPLNTRGWTLQETVLSPRSVCFGKDQWLWRCASRHATEDGFVDEDSSHGGGGFGLIQMASIAREGAGADGRAYFRHWYALAANYSRRGLTFRRDKLGAIAGLAGAFTKHTGCTYVAGLWAEDIAVGLMWNATSRGVTREAGAIPSWSWTSVDGEVMPPHLRGPSVSAPLLTLASIEQQWDGVPLSSRLLVAQLTVEGSLIQATLGQQSMTQKLRHHLTTGPGSEPESEEIIGEAFLDSSLAADGQPISVWCLRAFSVLASDGKPENYVLLLVPAQQEEQQDSDGGPRAYQRLGTGVIWEKGRRATSEASEGRDTFAEARTARVVLV